MIFLFCLGLPLLAHAEDAAFSDDIPKLRNWLLKNRDETTGLPYSHVGDKRFEKWCITYDAAVTAMAFIALGDSGEARKVIDFYLSRPEPRRLGGLIEAVRVTSPPTGVEWSVRSGANVWLGIASFHLYRATGDAKYLDFAAQVGDFALRLQDKDPNSPTFGGIRLGPAGDANFEGDQHLGHDASQPAFEEIFATEVAIDSSALLGMLAAETGEARFQSGRDLARHWLEKAALNRKEHRWNRGYRKSPDKAIATDIHAWGISALGVDALDAFEPGLAENMAGFVEEKCRVTVDATGSGGMKVRVTGFDFVDHAAAKTLQRPPMVSPEWSFQMANAYQRLADDFAAKGEAQKAESYRRKKQELIGSVMAMAVPTDGALAFPYASLPDALIGHEYRTPLQGNFSVIGVAYAILSIKGFDPLRPPSAKRAD